MVTIRTVLKIHDRSRTSCGGRMSVGGRMSGGGGRWRENEQRKNEQREDEWRKYE